MYVKAFIVNVNKRMKPVFLEQHINIVNRVTLQSFWFIFSLRTLGHYIIDSKQVSERFNKHPSFSVMRYNSAAVVDSVARKRAYIIFNNT